MPRHKGSTNKLTSDIKERLQSLIDEVVNSIDISAMDTAEKLKLLQLSLHYVIPKLRSTEIVKEHEDLPLFIDEICVYERKEGLTEDTESEVWADNFNVTETYKVGS